jgi:hypothetical protein
VKTRPKKVVPSELTKYELYLTLCALAVSEEIAARRWRDPR